LPTQITSRTAAVNFGAHFCFVSNPIAQAISKIPLIMIQKNSLPNAGGTRAMNTPGLTKWKDPLRRKIKTIIFVPIGRLKLILILLFIYK
jgi:hypothetical protein